MQHLVAYLSADGELALAALLVDYGQDFMPAANKRIGIEGTLQRPPYTPGMWREWVERHDTVKSKGESEVFVILVKDVEAEGGWRYVGHTGLHGIKWPNGTATTGSMIVNGEYRGKGYGTIAKLLLLKHAFHVLGLRKVHSRVKAWNATSLGHLVKCGYTLCGRHKAEDFHEGTFVDEILLEVFRAGWEPIWDAYQATGELPRLTDGQRALIKKETNT